ncbi:DUF6777 domain-containing protein [Actinomadura sp. 9N407]|uniref:DUF6777 domain-containing protein n=1 Tax=Actinomadura sp. 9N407 TaxID=3375154 RepID=UPI003792A952
MPEINFRILGSGAVPVLLLGAMLAGCGDAGETITRLTVGSAGPDPYTVMANTDRREIKLSTSKGGTKDGNAPGLYGGTRQAASCDPAKLIAFLQANPGKAKAWASVHRIGTGDISGFVGRLTPVLLRTDTLVTNHGFKGGKATRGTAVLQAGMGVLVNEYGVPVVKCNCGNPLTQPEKKISTGGAEYTGASWPGFSKRGVTKIRIRTTVQAFVLVDPEATIGFDRPVATTGGSDGPPEELPVESTPTPDPSDSGSMDPSTPPVDPSDPGIPSGEPGTEPPPVTETPGDGGEPAPDGGPVSEPPPASMDAPPEPGPS